MNMNTPKAKDPKVIAITGASRGLGAALALEYAASHTDQQPIHLFLSARNQDLLNEVAAQCRKSGAQVDGSALDVTDAAACADWIRHITGKAGRVDLLIANAGISGGTSPDPQQEKMIFDVNLHGVLHTVHPAIQAMRAQEPAAGGQRGHIALMASLAGYRGMPGAPAYCASKAAVKSYGESLRGALEADKIDVSVICPGFVKTDMTSVNPFKMPFLMEARKAAQIMARGLNKRKGRIAFPLPMAFAAWLLSALPDGLAHLLTRRTPEKD